MPAYAAAAGVGPIGMRQLMIGTFATNAVSESALRIVLAPGLLRTDKAVLSAAVANELWFKPERASVCGMCLKVSLPPGTASSDCAANSQKIASCPGAGTHPYTSVDQPWAWNATVYPADSKNPYPYFIAVIIEWFDRCVNVPCCTIRLSAVV